MGDLIGPEKKLFQRVVLKGLFSGTPSSKDLTSGFKAPKNLGKGEHRKDFHFGIENV